MYTAKLITDFPDGILKDMYILKIGLHSEFTLSIEHAKLYNTKEEVSAAIKRVKSQTFPETWEIIVV